MKPYEYLLPTCCEAARTYPAVFLTTRMDSDEVFWTSAMNQNIEQDIGRFLRFGYYQSMPDAAFCPYCGKPLPKLRKRAVPPAPLCVPDDGGYYCTTCGKRLNCCECLPPEAAWEPDVDP